MILSWNIGIQSDRPQTWEQLHYLHCHFCAINGIILFLILCISTGTKDANSTRKGY